MRSKMTRILMVLLVSCLALAMIACQAAPATQTSQSGQTTTSGTTTGTTETTKEPAEIVTLQVFSMPSNDSGIVDGWWADMVREAIGVEVELLPSGDQGEQKLQALMAGGELPDIVVFKAVDQLINAIRANMVVALDEHQDKLPNLFTNDLYAPMISYYQDNLSNGQGKLFSIGNSIGPANVPYNLNFNPNLRWDIYTQIGAPAMADADAMLDVLKQMQDAYPETEDGQKVYGLTLWSDWDNYNMALADFYAFMWGANNDFGVVEYDYLSKTIRPTIDADSTYVKMLKFFYKANQMGLLDPDSLTQRFDAALEKFNGGRILWAPWAWLSGGYNTADRTGADNPTGYMFQPTQDMKIIWDADMPVGGNWSTSISAATTKLDRCLEFVNYLASYEYHMNTFNGPQGAIWDIGSDGKPYVTEDGWNIANNNLDMPGGGKLGDGGSWLNVQFMSGANLHPDYGTTLSRSGWEDVKAYNPTKLTMAWREKVGHTAPVDWIKADNIYVMASPAFNMLPVTPDAMQVTFSQIGNVVKTSSWKMVFARDEAEFDALYQDMLSQAEGLGLADAVAYCETALKTALDTAAKYN